MLEALFIDDGGVDVEIVGGAVDGNVEDTMSNRSESSSRYLFMLSKRVVE